MTMLKYAKATVREREYLDKNDNNEAQREGKKKKRRDVGRKQSLVLGWQSNVPFWQVSSRYENITLRRQTDQRCFILSRLFILFHFYTDSSTTTGLLVTTILLLMQLL